jgi:hypothetical protein
MKWFTAFVAAALVVPSVLAAQQPPTAPPGPEHALLDKLTGHWVMRGTIGKQATTHDADAQWVLDKEYVQIHEVSREKDAAGKPQYEAMIYVVWDPKVKEFAVMWLDNTGVSPFAPEGIGHAKATGDTIAFHFRDANGDGVNNTLAYDRAKNSWSMAIDNLEKGTLSTFARLTMTRQ